MKELEELVQEFLAVSKERRQQIVAPIMEQIQGPAFRLFVKYGVPIADAPDAASQFFEDLFKEKLEKYRRQPDSSIWAWLSVVVKRDALDWKRAHPHQPEEESAANKQSYLEWHSSEARETHAIEAPSLSRAALIAAVMAEFDKLSEKDRDVLRLKDVAEMAYRQIATALAESNPTRAPVPTVGSLKTRRSRVLQRLRTVLLANPKVSELLAQQGWKGDDLNERSRQRIEPR